MDSMTGAEGLERDHVEGRDPQLLEQVLKLLAELVACPTPNPPGDEDRILPLLERWLSCERVQLRRVPLAPGRSSLLATLPGRDPSAAGIVLCAHLDTVRADEPGWRCSPFGLHAEGERLYGRGTADMKGGVAVTMALFRRLAARGEPPARPVVLALTADEERGYKGAASLVDAGLLSSTGLLVVAEPTAGQAYIGQKGELWVEAGFDGRAAHGSVPELGAGTTLPTAELALAMARQVSQLPALAGRGRTSLNVGEIHGGWQINVVPERTRMKLDMRVASEEHRDTLLEALDRLGGEIAHRSGTRFARTILMDQAPIVSDVGDPLVAQFLSTAARVSGRAQPPVVAPYSTDAVAIVPRLGVPVIIYGPGSIAQAHQPDEYIERASLAESLRVLGEFLDKAVR